MKDRPYEVYTVIFKDGTEITVSQQDGFRNQLDVYNWMCRWAHENKKIGNHGGVEEITSKIMMA